MLDGRSGYGPLAEVLCPEEQKAADVSFSSQAGVYRNECEKLQRASRRRRGFQFVVPIEEEMA